MSSKKKEIRKAFRDSCFKRDKFCCVMCGFKSTKDKAEKDLDCHHICARDTMPNGGYCMSNGISLCSSCHIKAEKYYSTGIPYPGYSVDNLFEKINSSFEKAFEESKLL